MKCKFCGKEMALIRDKEYVCYDCKLSYTLPEGD